MNRRTRAQIRAALDTVADLGPVAAGAYRQKAAFLLHYVQHGAYPLHVDWTTPRPSIQKQLDAACVKLPKDPLEAVLYLISYWGGSAEAERAAIRAGQAYDNLHLPAPKPGTY